MENLSKLNLQRLAKSIAINVSSINPDISLSQIRHELSLDEMAFKFSVTRNIVNNILRKKCWENATKDLPDLELKKSGYRIRQRIIKERKDAACRK